MSNRFVIPDGTKWVAVRKTGLTVNMMFYSRCPYPIEDWAISHVDDFLHAHGTAKARQAIREKPLSERIEPARNKYHREIKPSVWVDVYDVLAAFTGRINERAKPAIDHAIKKLLAPGLRGVKEEKQDLIEARDSLNRAIESLDEWA